MEMKSMTGKVGYIVFDEAVDVGKVLRELCEYVGEDAGDDITLCGVICFDRGRTERFRYYLNNITGKYSIECCVRTAKSFIQENIDRKEDGLKCLPFDKQIDIKKSFYVSYQGWYENGVTCPEGYKDDTDRDIKRILSRLTSNGYQCRFVEVKVNKPILAFKH